MANEVVDPDEATRISAAIVKAITEAKAMVDAGDFGPALHDVVQHARELHDLLLEQVTAEPRVVDRLGGLCDAIGENVRRLEELGEDDPDLRPYSRFHVWPFEIPCAGTSG